LRRKLSRRIENKGGEKMIKIALGCDHGGFELKEKIKGFLEELKIEYKDFGSFSKEAIDYPEIAIKVCSEVQKGNYKQAILICGTGIGMSIVANKMKGIRASLCHDVFSARYTRLHNDANILTMGGRVIGPGLAREIIKTWLDTSFSEEERHIRRLSKISQIEEQILS